MKLEAEGAGVVEASAFEVDVELDQEGFGEGVLLLDGVEGGEEELQGGFDLGVFRAGFEVLDEDTGGNV